MSWDYPSKNANIFTGVAKNADVFVNTPKNFFEQFLLMEDGGHLLLETGAEIILDQSVLQPIQWVDTPKN